MRVRHEGVNFETDRPGRNLTPPGVIRSITDNRCRGSTHKPTDNYEARPAFLKQTLFGLHNGASR